MRQYWRRVAESRRGIALLLVGDAQGYIGVRVAGRELEAAVQQLHAFFELAICELKLRKIFIINNLLTCDFNGEKSSSQRAKAY